jgi:hypothetical protein
MGVVVVMVMEITMVKHLRDGCILDHLNNRLPDFKFLQRHMQKQRHADSKNVTLSNTTYTSLAESSSISHKHVSQHPSNQWWNTWTTMTTVYRIYKQNKIK